MVVTNLALPFMTAVPLCCSRIGKILPDAVLQKVCEAELSSSERGRDADSAIEVKWRPMSDVNT